MKKPEIEKNLWRSPKALSENLVLHYALEYQFRPYHNKHSEAFQKPEKFNSGLLVGCQHNATAVATTINFTIGRRT